jgi:serine/threonine-protein phosphatase 6 regulatory ankyrin repeat subunit B
MNNNDKPLIDAIKSNNISLVTSLIGGGSVNVNARIDKQTGSALHLAAQLGHVEIVALLLDAGARIDDVNDLRDTACHIAVREGRTDVVELLVARNANLSQENRALETPLRISIDKKNEPLVVLLIDAALAAGTPLEEPTIGHAATVGTDVVRILLFKYGIQLDKFHDHAGNTPLHHAVWHKRDLKLLDMLIDVAGIDVDARGRMGLTVAHVACAVYDVCVLARLITAGANLELADNSGNTPLHFSRVGPSEEIAVFLLAAGANVHARNRKGHTVCHFASKGSHAALPALLAFGANLDEPDNNGITPRQLLKTSPPTDEEIALARRRVLNVQFSFVRQRAFEICVALRSLRFDALCMCEILLHSCGPVARFVPFHMWWQVATKVKHWRQR